MTLEREELRDDWTVAIAGDQVPSGAPADLVGRALPATVPGQVHTDLEREGVIADPTFDRNEDASAWVGRADWAYRRHVDVDPRGFERVDLVCDGLDTVAELSLDGVVLGTTRNMHRRYRFDLNDVPGPTGRRELELLFESAYREAGRVAARAGAMPGPYDEPFPYVRKQASNFGWDWGLTAVTSGPWRPVAIERWSTARLAEVQPLVDVEAGEGVLDAHVRVERSGMNDLDQDGEDDDLVLVVTVAGPTVDGGTTRQRSRAQLTPKDDETVVTVRVPDALRWWPRGYGAQPRYDVTVELQTVDGEVLDRHTAKTGFRSARIDTTDDAVGKPFDVVVNGAVVDVGRPCPGVRAAARRGGPRREPRPRLGRRGLRVRRVLRRVRRTRAARVAGLRVRLRGVPGDRADPQRGRRRGTGQRRAALRSPVARALERQQREHLAARRRRLGRRTRRPRLGARLLPRPAADDRRRGRPVALLHGRVAVVRVREPVRERRRPRYRDSVPRFVSEFGWQAPPAWRTLRDAVTDEPLRVDAPGVVHHQKADDGMAKLARGIAPRFGSVDPSEFDRWHYLTQLQQARAVATGVEHWRTHWPRNTGVVLWQLNDLWPVSSWSAVDSAGRLKPLAHELRRLYDDVLLTIRPVTRGSVAAGAAAPGDVGVVGGPDQADGSDQADASGPTDGSRPAPDDQPGGAEHDVPSAAAGGTAELVTLSDTLSLGVSPGAFGQSPVEVAVRSARAGRDSVVRVRRVTVAGTILAEVTLPVRLSEAGVAVVALPESVGVLDDPTRELVVADMDWRRAVWTATPDKDVRWEPARYRTTVTPAADGDGHDLVVEADSLVRDLLVQPDRLAPTGTVDRGFMTLLPGERVDFRLRGLTDADVRRLGEPFVLSSLDEHL
ncbi:hypothetical protein HUN58_19940 [Curtobacterium sp. Csp1]|uniref:glycosyl hydrolase 2 galactose-binding domain-containing protein n=1 Tax=Curtobacterium sp. Csp1 TaxID=2495429 RepID=UPI001598D493|nr:hypothetical protein [Curtobacterium sp. Csp1]QKS21836.1 hypothetical protein HUN58_19940 [Curtobacterium sp. Csp1]